LAQAILAQDISQAELFSPRKRIPVKVRLATHRMAPWFSILLLVVPLAIEAAEASCGATDASCSNARSDESSLLQSMVQPETVGLGAEEALPSAYKLQKGTCNKDSFTGGGEKCDAPWVYCTDANCHQDLVESQYTPGVLAARCHCWMPKNTNFSVIPKETAGAGCVANQIAPGKAPFGVTGGSAMCEKMKEGALISTYGPTGTSDIGIKIHSKSLKCEAYTPWAWCWGAPCSKDEFGLVTCECPVVISDWNQSQFVAVSDVACSIEKKLGKDKCKIIHNGSPARESPMFAGTQCD